jgi:ABC-type bacteriocin/lantibiotic exporter with double-glycine peptidase domain
VWLDVPFVRQPKDGCGAASVSMIVQYWKRAGDSGIDQIHAATYSRELRGAHTDKLKQYLSERGFRVFDFAGAWQDLREQIDKGRPVIVCLQTRARQPRHYVVVAGIAGKHLLVNDPADRKLRRMERTAFEKSWVAAGSWMLLAVPGEGP